ncbi:hypothetical protein BWI96_21020 [Siphonobacter sp. SORGH_AS_0500]|uniref:glycoside hydrolase family 2 TIM barrel-domain containing protein n=1 Tax=Siphonobacter sp. SORGH_AS_0500 TaxID=1864824 RepID=UPI000CAC3F9F|nr:glycoside hydrolase family 2 TIM barrel-domain containing protein [Siphonobacter sp. SORGH_AS_0500]PKK34708.1 hypothetical protein BWI96_21020 [Siphonobacter sp. SORGH_AS_0500]
MKSFLLILPIIFIFSTCNSDNENSYSPKVRIVKSEGKYILYRDGKPFTIKGAAGYSHFSELRKAGGNAIRIWDTLHLATILDSAWANNLSVIVGLPIPDNKDYMIYYDNPDKVASQLKAYKTIVNTFKAHPAVLMWCVGNELTFPYGPAYNNFYKAFNELVEMIHQDDPDHPVTTTILNFNEKYIFNLSIRCRIDLISFNIFSLINKLRDDLNAFSWFWDGPYLLTEWGVDGPWSGTEQTAWGAYIENTSTKKAEIVLNRYRQFMPVDDPRFLGAFVFFWGQKQETTPTWFSLFDETGARSELVNTMHTIWTRKPALYQVPAVKYMLVDQKGARDNILLNPNQPVSAEVLMESLTDTIKAVKWQIFNEDWYAETYRNAPAKPTPLSLFTAQSRLKATFVAPSKEGPYRLFATIYNHNGSYATCNTPFYVVGKP